MTSEARYDSLILFYADKWGRNPRQVKKQIRMESNFNPKARNKGSGASGLLQFMKGTWDEWWDGTAGIQTPADQIQWSPYDPECNLNASCAYMAALDKQFGRLDYALAAYNWGPGNLRKLLKKNPSDWLSQVPEETRNYVKRGLDYKGETLITD
jgi:soluble lytic murein transglycosylase-like protein